ncbi:MAG: BON domain-containing protein [Steroidobacteraceae bacterium]
MHYLSPFLLLCAALAGCSAIQVYRECGYEGCPADRSITAEVLAQLQRHPALGPPNSVRVQTLGGVVYLTGQVSTDYQAQLAESVAQQAAGANRVVNTLALPFTGR